MRKSVKCRQLGELTCLGFIRQIVSYEAEINNLKANVNHSNHLLENHRTRVGIAIKGYTSLPTGRRVMHIQGSMCCLMC